MRRTNRTLQRSWLWAGGLYLAVCATALPASAAEPAREFLDKLRERGYYDTALDYLDQVETLPNIPQDLKAALPYEKGTTLIDASRSTRDAAIRAKQLNDAQAHLEGFIKNQPSHTLAFSAQKQVGNLMVERARIVVERAKKTNSATEFKMARDLYQSAYDAFNVTQKAIADRLKQIPPKVEDKDVKLKELQEQLRIDYLQTQLLAAAIKEEMTDTMTDKKAKEYKDTLLAAAKEYGEIYDKYRTRLAGLYARMYQGRCHQKVGDDKEALSYFVELLEEPDAADEVRVLKTKVLVLAVKSWSAASQKKYPEAIAKGTAWLEKIRPNEGRDPDWLELRLHVAKAMKAYAGELQAKDAKQATGQIAEARKQANIVAKIPSELQKDAKQLLVDLGIEKAGEKVAVQPKNFNEAFEAGKEEMDAMRVAQQMLSVVPGRLKTEKDAQQVESLKAQLSEAQNTVANSQGEAQRLFTAALGLAKDDTAIEQVNLVQYYLCYLAYLQGDYHAAALIGDFVARRYPDSPGARQCAKIAMAAYVKLFADVQKEEKAKDPVPTDAEILALAKFESDGVVSICEYITQKWPEHPEAAEALNTLIPFMISTGQLAQAEAYLQKIPAESDARGTAELKTGQAMWAEYLKGTHKVREWEKDGLPEGTDLPARKKELTELKARAQKTLEDGVARMKQAGATNPTFASAMLSLAQIYVDTNQPAKAIAELEDAKVGPLTLVAKNDPSVNRAGFAEEVLKVALRAQIGSLADPNVKADDALKKAQAIMADLKKSVGDAPQSQEKLVRIYIGIARDLESQIKLAENPAAKTALSQGFEKFLSEVGKEATEFNVLNWVAETFFGMGEALSEGVKGAPPADAKRYYEKASEQFTAIIAQGAKQKDFYDPKLEVLLRLRTANCKRKLGDSAGAIKDFEAILKDNPMMVNVQVDAAHALQEFGQLQSDPKFYFRAVMGGQNKAPGKTEPIIWGWGIISRKTANNAAFKDVFMEARYNLAICRYRMGKLEKNAAKQKEFIEGAERDIKNVAIVDREYGGENWKPKFDTLAREIQRDLKKKQEGVKAFEIEIKPVANSSK